MLTAQHLWLRVSICISCSNSSVVLINTFPKTFGKTFDRVSNSLDPDEIPSYSASHLDAGCSPMSCYVCHRVAKG